LSAAELPIEQIERIQLERPGMPTMKFARTLVGWEQTEPYPHPADAAALRQLIDVASSLEQTRAVDLSTLDAPARAALGLEPPQAMMQMSWKGGECLLELGRRTVAGRGWIRANDRMSAASVDASLHALALDGDLRQLRSMALYDAQPGEAERIELKYGAGPSALWTLERKGLTWRVVTPFNTRADSESVRSYVEAVSGAQADAFAADQPQDFAAFGLAPPAVSLTIVRSNSTSPATVEVGSTVTQGAQERFGRIDGRPAVLQLGTRALAALFPAPAFFIDPRGTDVVPADVRRIEVQPAVGTTATPFALQRTRDRWELQSAGAAAAPASSDAVRRLLTQLAQTRAPEVSLEQIPQELLVATLTLKGEKDAVLAVIRLARGGSEGAGKWALDNDDGVLRVFPQNFDVRVDADAYVGSR
jgi:hypothetical protein